MEAGRNPDLSYILPRMKTFLVATGALFLCLAPAAARAETQSTDDVMATIAMLEDTRCPDGQQVSAYLADTFPPAVRQRAARALARLQDSTTVPALAERLRRDPDPDVRKELAFALGEVGKRQAFDALSFAYDSDTDPEVRALAIEAVGKIGDPRGTAL